MLIVLVGCAPPTPAAPSPTATVAPATNEAYVPSAPLSDASTSAQMIATNQAQFYVAVPDPVIFNALSRGVAVKLLVSSTTNAPTDRPAALMVRQDLIDSGRFESAADLKGMTIASGAISAQFYVSRALAKGGLSLTDAKVVNVGGLPDEITALQNKSVDAAWEVEPLITTRPHRVPGHLVGKRRPGSPRPRVAARAAVRLTIEA